MAETVIDVIVVGGGVSGLAAAAAVRRAGGRAIVLEAASRIGGRVLSYRPEEWCATRSTQGVGDSSSDGAPHTLASTPHARGCADASGPMRNTGTPAVDLGAAWVHGASKQNPLTRLTELQQRIPTAWEPGSGGRLAPKDWEVAQRRKRAMEAGRRALLSSKPWKRSRAVDVPLWDGLLSLPSSVVDHAALTEHEAWVLRYCWELDTIGDYAGTIVANVGTPDERPLSFLAFDDDEDFDGEDELLPGGLDAILSRPELDGGHKDVTLNARVVSITVENEWGVGVVVTTADGTAHRGTACICTLPLGVLKSPSCPTFIPALPHWKRDAIDKLQVGVFNKAVLEFDTTWWPSDDHVFYNPTKGATFPFFVNYRPIINRPVIVGFFCGPSARDVEAMDDAEVAARCIAELIQCTHCLDSDITPLPKPTRVVVTRWGSDENTLGSYAHIPMGASGRDCESLGRSVGPLLWAGEATSEYIGTVHGAYLSGCMAAKEAIQRYLRA